ncbi:MAG: Coenzyme F420 hydrogenase/dehydrogenase, beta subunit C-terminal domain [Acutalibacteraceae bacterium]|nr:Coenzyme F420 hydrogenase/dehydrogenase, beta subunit C-terminal domain [Acutalibacteraceae bacterium]
MLKISEKKDCTGCYACAAICKNGAIVMKKDEEGFRYPVINESKCIKCKLCERVCPVKNQSNTNNILESYAAFNKNDEIRKLSSSGGLFTRFAKQILDEGGVVFGAAFDENYNVHHIYVKTEAELEKLRSSKYLQSQIKDSFVKAKFFLDKGRKVLFSGTPCQVAGLKSFLRREYKNLYTQDIICHGVPSPQVWQKYLTTVNTENKKIEKVCFRSKRNGWKNYGLEIVYEDSTDYFCDFRENTYSKAFLNNLCLRPSCYECAFKKQKPFSDVTLADYWGVDIENPKIDDNKGISVVIINSEKGKELLFNEKDKLFVDKLDISVVLQHNSSLVESSPMNKKRDYFMRNLGKKDFDKLVDKCTKPKRQTKLVHFTRRAFGKVKRTIVKKR